MVDQFTQIIDFYLSKEGSKHLPEIQRLAKLDSKESDEQLLRYCLEAVRLNDGSGLYREAQTSLAVTDEAGEATLQPGDKVLVSFVRSAPLLLCYSASSNAQFRPKPTVMQASSLTQRKCVWIDLWIPTSAPP